MMKNFTVIGNMLFFHVNLDGKYDSSNFLVEIPPEIYYRLTQYTMIGYIGRPNFDKNDAYPWQAYISEKNGKYYLKTQNQFSGKFIFSSYMYIKDI